MANPQAENGHVDIANEIIDALALYRIPGEAMQCLWVVFRKTYGWKKLDDEISLTQFSNLTGLSRSSTVRAIKWLVTKKILYSYKEGTTYANKYKFNKNFDLWIHGYKKDTTKKVTIVTKTDTDEVTKKEPKVVTKKEHTKDTSKDTITKDIYTHFEDFWDSYPKRNGKKIGKDETLARFVLLEDAEQRQAVAAAKNYFNSSSARSGFAVDPVRFFRSREYPSGLWREWMEPESRTSGGSNGKIESVRSRKISELEETRLAVRSRLGISGGGSNMANRLDRDKPIANGVPAISGSVSTATEVEVTQPRRISSEVWEES